ncbi:MAG: MFS transporter, partial [Eisenbergiella massiliensis]
LYSAMLGVGTYYMKYVMGNENLFSYFAWAINIPLIIALIITPSLVSKWKGMYKLNMYGYAVGTLGRALVVVAAYMGNIPLMFLFTGVAAFGMGPWQGDMNAVIAECSQYTYFTKGKRVEGTMYSCTSLGVKLGGGLGVAIQGWLLELAGYKGTLAVQPDSAINMLHIMYLWLPVIITLLITFIMSKMKVEKANAELREARKA